VSVKPSAHKKQAIISPRDFNLIIRIIKNNWWVPLLILPFFYAAGYFYVYRLTTVYKASTEFLLKTDDTYYRSNLVTDANFYSNVKSYIDNSNETRIVKSYDLARKVVRKLQEQLQVSYFIVGKVRTTEQFTGMPFDIRVNSIHPQYYEKVFNFQIIDFDHYEISFELDDGKRMTKRGKFDADLVDLEMNLTITRAETFSKNAVNSLKEIFYQFSIHSEEFLINRIRQNLSVENPEYTQILRVSLADVLPERAIIVLDTLNAAYSENKLISKFELNERTVDYIDKQLNEITYSLRSIEDTMQSYKERKSIIDLGWQQSDFLGKIGTYDLQRSQMQLQLEALQDLEKYIIEDKDPQFLPPSIFVFEKEGYLQKTVNDLYSEQLQLNKLYNSVTETNPRVAELKSSIRKNKEDLLVYIQNTKSATGKQIANLNKEILQYINEAKMIPGKQRDILNIQRKANVSEQLYNFLLEKRASTKIARASIVPDVKIVEAPRYDGVISPDRAKILKQVLTIGVLLSLVIIFIRTAFYARIKSVAHLKEVTELPLIGVLPRIKEDESEGIVVEQSPNSFVAESFRNLRTNLQYANVDSEAKTLLITSFLPGEGKTFTSVNLAAILARSGKRTVVLELDLHKPRVFKRFGSGMQNIGITTYVNGNNTFEEITNETPIPNLYAIYAGPIPPNPSDYVLSGKLKELLDRAKNEFEFVIIDTPPAGLLSDSMYLIQYVDASVFVLNTKTATKKVVNFVEEIIETNKLKNVLLLLNGVSRPGKRYYYQGYGYSYGYGYGYGYGKGKGY
jgi:capsular exopolysaccharide synthesis family protein